jgi:hypothetical protein
MTHTVQICHTLYQGAINYLHLPFLSHRQWCIILFISRGKGGRRKANPLPSSPHKSKLDLRVRFCRITMNNEDQRSKHHCKKNIAYEVTSDRDYNNLFWVEKSKLQTVSKISWTCHVTSQL